jgi:CBS domain-containing protein
MNRDRTFQGRGKLPVCTRHVYSGHGELSSEHQIFCPLREQSLAVEDCEACEDYDGLAFDLDKQATRHRFVVCRGATVEAARALGRGPRASLPRRRPCDAPSLADRTPIFEIMTSDVRCAREDLELDALTQLLLTKHVSGLPVVDASGYPIGLISKTDLLRERDGRTTAGELMTPLVFPLPQRATVSQAAALMALEGVHRVPVISDDSKLIGMVTSLDVLGWLGRADGYLPPQSTGDCG